MDVAVKVIRCTVCGTATEAQEAARQNVPDVLPYEACSRCGLWAMISILKMKSLLNHNGQGEMMSRHPKSLQDEAEADAEAIAEAQADMEEQIESELSVWDDMVSGYSQFGFGDTDYQYLGPVISNPVENEADMSSSQEDWKEFLRKIEEDLSK